MGNGGSDDNPFRLFQHLLPNNIPNSANTTTNNDNPLAHAPTPETHGDAGSEAPEAPAQEQAQVPPPHPPQDGRNGRRALFGGMLSFDLGPGGLLFPLPGGADGAPPMPFPMGNGPDDAPNAQQQNGPLPPHLADLLARIGAQVVGNNFAGFGFGMENQEDPDRARKLVDGLEVVPEGLVRRLERVGGTGGGMGEDDNKGGDSGCAICWDRLLDTDGAGFGSSEMARASADTSQASSGDAEITQPKIVSLPCAHVFHADCLIPWFSRPRQTTCPTCRFNIDPDNLTFVSWQRRQRERREAEAAAAGTAEGANPVDGTPVPDAAAGAEAPGAAPAANTPNINGDDLFRQFADFYANTTADQQLPPAQQDQQQQGDQLSPLAQPLQGGPAVNIASIPLPLPIPVAIPLGSINHPVPPNGTGMRLRPNALVPMIDRLTLTANTPPAANGAEGTGEAPQPAERHHHPRPETGSGIAGDYARLFARLGRPSHAPVPLDALFPPSFRDLGNAENPQAAGAAANLPPTGAPLFPQSNYHEQMLLLRSLTDRAYLSHRHNLARRFTLNPLGNLQPLPNLPSVPRPTGSANPPTPAAEQQPHPNTNTFNLPGLDFGVPGMRADVVVTMDMFFDPRGPPGPDHPHDGHAAGDHHPHEEDIVMEEDIMMMMPEGHEDEEAGGDEMAGFGEEMLRMFTGAVHGGHNANAERRDREQQHQQDQAPPADNPQQPPPPGLGNMGNGIHFAAGSGRSMGEAFAQLLARMSGAPPPAQPDQASEQAPPAQPHGEGAAQPPPPDNVTGDGQPRRQRQARPAGPPPFTIPAAMFGGFPGMVGGTFGPRPPRREGPKPAWSVPPAPGLTLRQRVERREREAGLRCCDISCGLGPSDEDPFTDKVGEAVSAMKQLSIRGKTEEDANACEHRFHSACLVSAERVALRSADTVAEDGQVNVSCPVCRTTGCVTKEEWDEGVVALEA